jgi:hypothetical protein
MSKLSDILTNGALRKQWNETAAAGDFEPLPPGEYVARIIAGELTMSRRNQTPGYKLTFRVLEGEHKGRQFWHDIWLTPAALPMAKRDLTKLGVSELEQLEHPLPQGIRCRVVLAVQKDDNGNEFNRVRRFDVLGTDPPELDEFAPLDDYDDGGSDA